MGPRSSSVLALSLAAAGTVAASARAQPEPAGVSADRAAAAAAFDDGVARYKRAEFADAARVFQEADRLAPSSVAISNAIAAAKRAGDHLLVAKLAERAIARGDAVVESREALADAATRLCRLDIRCDAPGCAITLDTEASIRSPTYALPGTHRVEGRAAAGVAEEPVACAAGATYHIELRPTAPPLADHVRDQPSPSTPSRGLHPAVFFTGVGVTAVLAAVTVWSGLDALSSKGALPAAPTAGEESDVLERARRTDYLLLGAGVAALGTAALGAFGTAWRAPASTAVFVAPRGVLVGVGGSF